jgi:DNA-binding transcriptional LysR family regulator
MSSDRPSLDATLAALTKLDLNLLPTLDALLEARSVTGTAERFGITQSAMSHRLARIRELFDDPLLVSAGDELVLTPKAESLQTQLRLALDQLRRAVDPEPEFDPKTAERTFVLAAADLAEVSLLPALLQYLGRAAPGVNVRMAGRRLVAGDALAEGKVDLAIAPGEGSIPGVGLGDVRGVRQRKLLTEGFCVLVRKDHPRVRRRLTLKRYLAETHVLVAPQGEPGGLVDLILERRGLGRHIAVQVASFLSAPFLVASTDHLLTCPRSLGIATSKPLGLRMLEPPLELPQGSVFAYWHERTHHDPGHQWFRDALFELVASAAK